MIGNYYIMFRIESQPLPERAARKRLDTFWDGGIIQSL